MKPRHAVFAASLAAAPALAQIESGERGIPVIASATSLEIGGVRVDVSGPNAQAAQQAGWREAQRRGWKALWAKTTGRPLTEAPSLPDGTLDAIVSGIVVEREQIGPNRYIADLGLLFDRARAGALLGVSGSGARSAPMLVIPVLTAGGTSTSVELRNPWQAAWARFRTAASPVDYVRVTGTGIDPLLVNAAQTRRPGRTWWRTLVDLYGTADVLVPEVQLVRAWPGGPIAGHFTARFGPDGRVIDRFSLRTRDGRGLARLMDAGVQRVDAAYTRALAAGTLSPDGTLVLPEPEILEPLEDLAETPAERERDDEDRDTQATLPPVTAFRAVSITLYTPDETALGNAQAVLRGVPGVGALTIVDRNLGGASTIRAIFAGDPETLRAALRGRGFQLGSSFVPTTPTPPPPPPPPPPALEDGEGAR